MSFISNYFSHQTTKDANLIIFSTSINSILGAAFFILVPKIIGPENYGVFSTVAATALFAAALSNLAMDTGIIKFADSKNNFIKFKAVAFKSYLISGVLVSVVGLLLSKYISLFLNLSSYTFHFQLAFVSLIFFLLTSFYTAVLQAKKDFLYSSILSISSNLARLLLLGIFFYIFTSNLLILLIIFFYVYIIPTILGFLYVKVEGVNTEKKDYIEFFKFNLPIALSLIISSIPFENYFLIKAAGPFYAGIYSAPFKILSFSYQIGGNFSKVLASHYSTSSTKEKIVEISKRLFPFVFFFVLAMLTVFIFSDMIIKIFFGHNFSESVLVMKITSIGFIFFFLSIIPSTINLYFHAKSNIILFIALAKCATLITTLYLLVTSYKAVGAAIAFSTAELISLAFMTITCFYYYRKNA